MSRTTAAERCSAKPSPAASDRPATIDDLERWTWRAAVVHSSRSARVTALVGTLALAASGMSTEVPGATVCAVAATIPAALVDLRVRRLPNRLLVIAGLVLATVAAFETLANGGIDHAGIAVGALAMAGPLLMSHVLSPSSLGFGDVKLAVVLGAALGLIDPTLSLLALCIGSAGAAALGLVRRRRTVAYGPALVAGAVATITVIALFGSPV